MSTLQDEALVHAKRIFKWRLNLIEPTARESERLDGAKEVEANDAVMRGFLAWRHTNLLVALPIVLFGSIWDLVLMTQRMDREATSTFNGIGNFLLRLPYLAPLFLLAGIGLCLAWWHQWRTSRNIVRVGWGLSFFLPFLPALFPIEALLTREVAQAFQQDETTRAQLGAIKIVWALNYLFTVLPLVITFPGGAVRAAIRTRGLLPQSSLAGRILVVSAPFYSLLILGSFVVIIQLLGNWILVIGAVILTLNPWIYVVCRNLYVSHPSRADDCDKHEGRLDLVQKVAALSNVAGFVLVFVWAFATGVVGEVVTVGQLVNILLRGFGNGLVTSIVFCDSFVRMSVSHWRNDRDQRMDDGGIAIDTAFSRLEAAIRKRGVVPSRDVVEDEDVDASAKSREITPDNDEETGNTSPSSSTLNAATGDSAIVATALPSEPKDEDESG
jgi:hypothetical protein